MRTHDDRIGSLDRDDHVREILFHTDAQELHARFYHALRGISVARHDAVGQRTVVHSDADGRVVFLTDVQKGDEAVAYLLDFFCILFIRILQLLEGTGSIYVVARVDTYLFSVQGRYLGYFRIEMYIGH